MGSDFRLIRAAHVSRMLIVRLFLCARYFHAKGYEIVRPPETGSERDQAAGREARRFASLCSYRYDEKRGVRLKTAEIIVEEKPSTPAFRYRDTDIVTVMVPYIAKDLREKLKAAGGRWDPEEKLWRVRYGSIRGDAGLVERIMRE